MKKSISLLAATFAVIFFLSVSGTHAQSSGKFHQDKGYFVLVSNLGVKNATTVQFYTNDNTLIYEEQVTGVKFNLNRKKVINMLNDGLEKAIIAWNEKPEFQKDKNWITSTARK